MNQMSVTTPVDHDATVIVVDDDQSVREALADLCRSIGLKSAVYSSAGEFLAAGPDHERPACLVLDVRLPGRSGLDLQAELRSAGVTLPIIFITGHGDIPMSVRAMKAGAVEFLTKPFRDQDLLDAIQEALALDRSMLASDSLLLKLRAVFARLTERERVVMECVVTGRPNKRIAADLGISEITVKVHRGRVMRKMQARSVAELVKMAAKLGLESSN